MIGLPENLTMLLEAVAGDAASGGLSWNELARLRPTGNRVRAAALLT